MKKIIVLVLTAFTFFGCGEELEFNTPSFQAKKDGNLWEAVTYRANIDNTGVLAISASDNLETITLIVNNSALGFHDMVQTVSSGTLLDIDDVEFSTNNIPDSSIQLYPADGYIELKEADTEAGYISGEFSFNAFSSSGLTSVNINNGFFYRIPLITTLIDPIVVDVPCDTATATVAATLINFNGVMTGDAGYEMFCNAYQTALETQKNSCGDPMGDIQTIIDGLDCTTTGVVSSIKVEVDAIARTFDDNVSVSLVGTTKTVRAEDSMNTDFIVFDIEENQTGTDLIVNFIINLNGINHEPIPGNMTLGEFTSTISTNTANSIQGEVSGAVNDYNGGVDVGLSMGVIDIVY